MTLQDSEFYEFIHSQDVSPMSPHHDRLPLEEEPMPKENIWCPICKKMVPFVRVWGYPKHTVRCPDCWYQFRREQMSEKLNMDLHLSRTEEGRLLLRIEALHAELKNAITMGRIMAAHWRNFSDEIVILGHRVRAKHIESRKRQRGIS